MRPRSASWLVRVLSIAAAGVLVGVAPASADEALATVSAPTPIVADGATVGWLTAPAATSGASKGTRCSPTASARGPS